MFFKNFLRSIMQPKGWRSRRVPEGIRLPRQRGPEWDWVSTRAKRSVGSRRRAGRDTAALTQIAERGSVNRFSADDPSLLTQMATPVIRPVPD